MKTSKKWRKPLFRQPEGGAPGAPRPLVWPSPWAWPNAAAPPRGPAACALPGLWGYPLGKGAPTRSRSFRTLPQFAKVVVRRSESGFLQLPCALGFRLTSSATGGARLPPPAPRWPGFPYSPGGRKAAQKAILSRSTRSCGCPGQSFRRGPCRFSIRIPGWS